MDRWKNFPDVSQFQFAHGKIPMFKKRSLRKTRKLANKSEKGFRYYVVQLVGFLLLFRSSHRRRRCCLRRRKIPRAFLPRAFYSSRAPPLLLFILYFLYKKEPTWAGDSSVVESPKPTNLPVPRLVSACVNPSVRVYIQFKLCRVSYR